MQDFKSGECSGIIDRENRKYYSVNRYFCREVACLMVVYKGLGVKFT